MIQPVLREDLLRYRFFSALAAAPDGSSAVFCLSQARQEENDYHKQLWIYRCGSAAPLPGTEGAAGFCFTDASHIAFPLLREKEDVDYARQGGYRTVFYRMDLETGTIEELFRVPLKGAAIRQVHQNLFLLSCVHDNARPDFESMAEPERSDALKAWREERADFEVCDELPFLSDGRGFVNKLRHSLYLYDTASGILSPLTEPSFETSLTAVSGDGKYIAFSGVAYDRMYVRTHGIYLYDTVKGRTDTLLTPGSYQVMGLDFLSGYELVVAAAPWNGEGPYPNHHLYTLPLRGGPMRLRHTHAHEDFGNKTCCDCRYGGGTAFRTAGGALYYFTTCDTASYLNRWVPGQQPVRLNGEDIVPDSFALWGGTVLVTGAAGGLQELFSLREGQAEQLTTINTAALENRTVIFPEKLQFTDRDGFLISGFVLKPVGFDPGKTYPGILEIHGGPRAAFSPGFFHEMQYLAGKGYFVFFCNPRGSAGGGEAFADLRACRGTVDYMDIMAWTDFVLEHYPQIDAARLGVMGGSYGGYMTNWIITHTDRFRAAVSMRSISNITADYGVTDCGVWGTPGVYGGTPWSHDELLREQSPLTYAMNVRTPTLFLHSFEDHRCSLGGAMQMFSALQLKGVPTRMCLFRRSCHELSRSGLPRSRLRRLKEIGAWMDQYLKEE